jgi:hypothetical protein
MILLMSIVFMMVLMLPTMGGSESLCELAHDECANVGRKDGFHRALRISIDVPLSNSTSSG